ncbi:MAG: methyl-accepting chemotaxis protein [Cellvibrionaceae bacterium]|nr:methyl-accepting chemotaxis protein [Cellvibrionaceae bacterium]
MSKPFSLAAKVYLALAVIATVLLAATVVFFYYDERALAEDLVKTNLEGMAENYFDSVNTMMLTGSMASRNIIQEKILAQESMVEARIIRAPKTVEVYGKGYDDQAPRDEFEQAALRGERGFRMQQSEDSHVLEFVMPVLALEDYHGTNCLACHQAQEGEVLGAVKLSYDLAAVDDKIIASTAKAAALQLGLTIICFVLLCLVFQRLILSRLLRLKGTINKVEQEMDLSREIPIRHQDEVGAVVVAINSMLGKFKNSFLEVSKATDQLVGSAQSVDDIASLTMDAVLTQKHGTESVAAAINELDASANEVTANTQSAAGKSELASANASQGLELVDKTRTGIFELRDEVEGNAEKIQKLSQKTEEVGGVLEVITGIAEQTNLLALNAAIEAARAGAQGRGFAVVADEVRQLANRTRDSIDQIQGTIVALQEDAKGAVGSMNQVREQAHEKAEDVEAVANLLTEITGQIKELDGLNIQIADSAKKQNNAADDINVNVTRIAEVAEQSSDDAVRGKEISEKLLGLSRELNQMLVKFNLGQN